MSRRSESLFGLSEQLWAQAKSQIRMEIVSVIPVPGWLTYGELSRRITACHVPPRSNLMDHLLGAVFQDEHAAGRPALTALVVRKDTRRPGQGFFDQAARLRLPVDDREAFWTEQVQRVLALGQAGWITQRG